MTRWFVDDVNGSNGNSGLTPTAAFGTIAHAYAVAASADTIAILPGTYRLKKHGSGSSITLAKKYLTFEGIGGSQTDSVDLATSAIPTLTVSDLTVSGNWTYDSSIGVYYYTQTSGYDPLSVFDPTFPTDQKNSDKVTDIGNLTSGSLFYEVVSPNPRIYYVPYSGSPAINPGSHSVEVPIANLFFTPSINENQAAYITFKNLRIHNWDEFGFDTGLQEGWRFINCIFSNGSGSAIKIRGNRTVIRGCYFNLVGERDDTTASIVRNDLGDIGVIHLDNAKDCIIEDNKISNFSLAGIFISGSANQSPSLEEGNNLVQRNYFNNGRAIIDSNGMYTNRGVITSTLHSADNLDFIQNNFIVSCGQSAFSLYDSNNVIFNNNTINDCGNGIFLNGIVDNCAIVNNIINECGASWFSKYHTFSNAGDFLNDFWIAQSELSEIERLAYERNEVGHNIYHREARGTQTQAVLQFRFEDRFYTLDDWPEKLQFDNTSLEESPGFIDDSSGDFTLDSGSNAIGIAEDLTPYFKQASEPILLYLKSTTDIGAIEFPKDFATTNKDLLLFLTGNPRTDNDKWGSNSVPALSVGGTQSDSHTNKQSIIISLENLFNHPSGDDLTYGITQYRAIDIKNISVRPRTLTDSGLPDCNFNSTTGQIFSLSAYISKVPRNVRFYPYELTSPVTEPGEATTQIAIAFELNIGSPSSFTGPLFNDKVAPSLITFSSPLTAGDAIISGDAVLLPDRTLDGFTTSEGESVRLWIRRTIAPQSQYEKEDAAEITLTGIGTQTTFGVDDTILMYVSSEDL